MLYGPANLILIVVPSAMTGGHHLRALRRCGLVICSHYLSSSSSLLVNVPCSSPSLH